MNIATPASFRSGFFTLPFVGSAHATRWPADHGRGLSIDRETGSATLWLGWWEVSVDVAQPGLTTGGAVAVLAGGAVLAALLGRR